MDLGWLQTAGTEVLHSYVVGLVELDGCHEADGSLVRVNDVMLDDGEDVAIGLPVKVEFEETNEPNIVVPRWKISGTAENTWKFSE